MLDSRNAKANVTSLCTISHATDHRLCASNVEDSVFRRELVKYSRNTCTRRTPPRGRNTYLPSMHAIISNAWQLPIRSYPVDVTRETWSLLKSDRLQMTYFRVRMGIHLLDVVSAVSWPIITRLSLLWIFMNDEWRERILNWQSVFPQVHRPNYTQHIRF